MEQRGLELCRLEQRSLEQCSLELRGVEFSSVELCGVEQHLLGRIEKTILERETISICPKNEIRVSYGMDKASHSTTIEFSDRFLF